MSVTTRRKKDIELDIKRIKELNLSGEDTLLVLCNLMNFMSRFQCDLDKNKALRIDQYLREKKRKMKG